jgi:hypothetical protein
VRGLKLIERDKNDNIYEVLTGHELKKHQDFTPGRKDAKNPITYGFEELRTNKAFKIKTGYKMPSKHVFKRLGKRRLKEGFQFAMHQFYEGKLLGSVGLKFGGMPRISSGQTAEILPCRDGSESPPLTILNQES